MLAKFLNEEEGAQVVEYALIIAVLSIALVMAVDTLTIGNNFPSFIVRVAECITTTTCA